jgi:hypothetical protein
MGQMDIIGSGAMLANSFRFATIEAKPGGKMWTDFHSSVEISVNHFCLNFK